MKRCTFLLFFIIAAISQSTAQQGEVRMTVGLNAAKPVGKFTDIIDNTSLRGVDINILYGFSEKFSGGLNVGFQDFYQKYPRSLYKLEDGSDISAVLTNSMQHIPLLLTGRYNFAQAGRLQPYATAGVGAAIVLSKQYVGEYPSEVNKFSLAARPGLGVYLPFKSGSETGLNFGVNYTFVNFKQDDVSNLGYLGVTLGIGFPMRN